MPGTGGPLSLLIPKITEISQVVDFSIHVSGASTVHAHVLPARCSQSFFLWVPRLGAPETKGPVGTFFTLESNTKSTREPVGDDLDENRARKRTCDALFVFPDSTAR